MQSLMMFDQNVNNLALGQLKSRQFGTLDLNLIKHNMTFTSPQNKKSQESLVLCLGDYITVGQAITS